MKVRIEKSHITRVLSLLQSVTEKKSIPYLSHVLLRAENGALMVSATDLDVFMDISVEKAEVFTDGSITAPARRLLEIVKEFPDNMVELTAENWERLIISTEKAVFSLPSLPPEDFPILTVPDSAEFYSINCDNFLRALHKTSYAIPTGENPLGGAGLYWSVVGEDSYRFVACDIHRLAAVEVLNKEIGMVQIQSDVLIPKKGVTELTKFVEENDEIRICVTENVLYAKSPSMVFSTRLLEESFSVYESIIPQERPNSLLIPLDTFRQVLKRMSIFTDQTWRHVKFSVDRGSFELSAGNPEIGIGREIISVDYDGTPTTMAFNLRYVLDAIGVIRSEYVRFEWTDDLIGGLFLDPDDPSYITFIMPVVVD